MLQRSVATNLRLYPVYVATRSLLFWVPVFFIYFSSRLTVDQVLWLESLYYFTNVVLEVPSGYFSDRFGRRRTLVMAALTFVFGYVVLALATEFVAFAAGQVLVAAGFALNPGTDSSMLFDSLLAANKSEEVAEREGRAWAIGFLASAFAAATGGLMASVDLRFGHGLTALGAVASLIVALLFVEPPKAAARTNGPGHLRQTLAYLGQQYLLWIFGFAVVMRVFEHVPYMFFQPYLELLFGLGERVARTPIISGVLVACMTLIAAWASLRAPTLARRFGPAPILLGALALYGVLCGVMALWLHPLVLVALALRSVPQAIASPVMSAAIHPRIGSDTRATYLSVQNLMGSLAFSGVLALTANAIGAHEHFEFATLANILRGFALSVLLCLAVLVATIRATRTAL